MAVNVEVVRLAAPAATGTQDFTVTGFGTAKACMVFTSYAVTDNTNTVHNGLCIGVASGTGATEEGCQCPADEDGVATQDCSRILRTDSCIWIPTAGGSSAIAIANFDSFVTDGIRLNHTVVSGNQELITVVLLGGTDFSAQVGSFNFADTVDQEVNVTTVGFQPTDILAFGSRDQALQSASGGDTENGYGVCHEDGAGTETQRGIGHRFDNSATTAAVEVEFYDTRIIPHMNNGAHDWSVECDNFDSGGLSFFARESGANNSGLVYLAMRITTNESFVGTYTTPTATGDAAETSIGFKPQFVMLGLCLAETPGTHYNDAHATSQAISLFTADDEFCIAVASEDGAATMNTQSKSTSKAVEMTDYDGTSLFTATRSSLDTNGFTLNYSATDTGTARKGFIFAIEEDAPVGGDPEGPLVGGKLVKGGILQGRLVG
jgi:hypothetical protein